MSGIYIDGLSLPREGYHTVKIMPSGVITLLDDKPIATAIDVPDHGRLGDLDALKHSFCVECTLYPDKCLEKTGGQCDWHAIYHIDNIAPTVIPGNMKAEYTNPFPPGYSKQNNMRAEVEAMEVRDD